MTSIRDESINIYLTGNEKALQTIEIIEHLLKGYQISKIAEQYDLSYNAVHKIKKRYIEQEYR